MAECKLYPKVLQYILNCSHTRARTILHNPERVRLTDIEDKKIKKYYTFMRKLRSE